MSELESLIFDTLYYRRSSADGCLGVNSAGLGLLTQNADALSSIERVLVQTVAPKFDSGRSNDFLGLDYLLGAYLVIGSKYDAARAVSFLKALPMHLQAEAIANVPIFLDSERNKSVSGVIVANEFLTYLNDVCESKCDELRTASNRARSFL
jgi:hypothetical protein